MDLQLNGYSGMSLQEIQALYEANRKRGNPSKEQRERKALIEYMMANNLKKLPKNGKATMSSPVVEEENEQETQAPSGETPKAKKGRAAKAKTESVTQIVEVPPIETGLIDMTVEGTESIIMHAWDVKSKRQIEEKQQGKAHRGRAARDPDAEFNAARYTNPKGEDCVPARHFKNAMVEAATFIPNLTKKEIKGAIYVKGDLLPLLDRRGKPLKPVKREDMVRIGGMSKVADIRYRPEYQNWRVNLQIEFDTSVFTAEQVVNLLNRAGFNVGVGEWRPTFGRFRVVRS